MKRCNVLVSCIKPTVRSNFTSLGQRRLIAGPIDDFHSLSKSEHRFVMEKDSATNLICYTSHQVHLYSFSKVNIVSKAIDKMDLLRKWHRTIKRD